MEYIPSTRQEAGAKMYVYTMRWVCFTPTLTGVIAENAKNNGPFRCVCCVYSCIPDCSSHNEITYVVQRFSSVVKQTWRVKQTCWGLDKW